MGKPVVCYLSMLRLATTTLTDPGTETGFSIAALSDLKAYEFWKSDQAAAAVDLDIDAGAGGGNADYVALVNHNLATLGATVTVYADGSFPPTTVRQAAFTPAEDGVTLRLFTAPGALRYWRVRISHAALPFAAKPFAAELQLGMRTTMPEYSSADDFDPFFRDVEVAGEESEGGHYLATVLRGMRHRGTLVVGGDAGVSRADLSAGLNAFVHDHAEQRKPFVFVVDPDDADFSAPRWVRVPDSGRVDRAAAAGSWARLTFSVPLREAFMERPA